MREKKKFTIIGFSKYKEDEKYYHCKIHNGARLLPKPDEKGAWWCPICGSPFRPNEEGLMKEEDQENRVLAAKMDPLTKPKIISGMSKRQQINRRKKRRDELGNEINPNDKDIMNDVAQGHTIAYYNETVYDDLNKNRKTIRDKDGNDVYVVRK